MKALKIAGIAVAVLVALAVIAAGVLIATFDAAKYKGELVRLVRERTGRTLAIEGDLKLSVFPSVSVVLGKTTLSEAGSDKVFASLGEARVSVAVMPLFSGRVAAERIVLSGLQADLVRFKDRRSNIDDLTGAGKPAPRPPAAPKDAGTGMPLVLDVAGVAIRASSFGYRDERDGTRVRLVLDELVTGRIADRVPGKLTVKAKVQGEQPKMALALDVQSGYSLDLTAGTVDLPGLDLKLAGDAPGAPGLVIALGGSAGMDWKKQTARGDLALRYAGQTVNAKFAVNRFAPLAARVDVSADSLDLDRLAPPAPAAAKDGTASKDAGKAATPAADTPVNLAALRGPEVSGSLKVGKLVARKVKAANVSAGFKLAGGRLDVAPLAADLYNGKLAGQATADANGNRVAMKTQLSDVEIGPLLRDAANKDLIEGKGNVNLDVGGAGATVGALKKSLAGSANLSLADGAIKGINIAESFRKMRSLGGSQEQGASSGEKTDFSELSASFRIAGGVARNDDLSAKSPFLRLSGAGNIDIGNDSMDYLAKAALVATSAGQGGRDAGSVAGLTIPVRISGPFDALKFRLEFGSLLGDSARKSVEEAKEKAGDAVKDRLKGLLRR